MNFIVLMAFIGVMLVPPLGHLRAEYPFIAILALYAFFKKGGQALRPVSAEVICLVGLSVSVLLSIIAYSLRHSSFSWRDLMSIARYLTMVAILVGTSTVYYPRLARERLLNFFSVLGALAALISIVQFYDIGGLNSIFLKLYRSGAGANDAYFATFVVGAFSRRVIGTAGNPNLWAYILTMLSLFIAGRVLISQRYQWMPVLILAIVASLMTGSRSGAIAFLVGLFVVVTVGARRTGSKAPALLASFAVLILIPLAFTVYTRTIDLENKRYGLEQIDSLFLRIEVWGDTLVEYSDDLLLGRGPAKAERRLGTYEAGKISFRDNIFISLYAQQGVLGLSIWLALLWVMWGQLRKVTTLSLKDPPAFEYSAVMTGIFASFVLINMTGDILFSVQPASMFLMMYGAAIGIGRSLSIHESESGRSQASIVSPWLRA